MGFGALAAGLGVLAPVASFANGAVDLWSANEDRKAQRDANNANIAFAREANQWSESMSNTSYQRAMKDMEAAGLNPMLAFSQGGAGTPSAQIATSQPASKGGMGRAVSKAIDSGISNAVTAQKLSNETTSTQSNVALQSSQRSVNSAAAAKAQQDTLKSAAETEATLKEIPRSQERFELEKEQKQLQNVRSRKDLEYYDTDKKIDRTKKITGAISDVVGAIKPGVVIRRGDSDYPTGTSGSKQQRYREADNNW